MGIPPSSTLELLGATGCDELEPGDQLLEVGAVSSAGCAWSAAFLLFSSHVSRVTKAQGRGESSAELGRSVLEQESQSWCGTGKLNCPEICETHHRRHIKRLLQAHKELTSCPDGQLSFRAKAVWSIQCDWQKGSPPSHVSC